MLHDGLCWTYPTSICHVLFHDTTRLVGIGAFASRFRGLEQVLSKWRYLVPPTSPHHPHHPHQGAPRGASATGNAHRWALHSGKMKK